MDEHGDVKQSIHNYSYPFENQPLSGASMTQGQPSVVSPFCTAYNDLEKGLAELGTCADRLRTRLAPILGPERTQATGGNPPQPERSTSELVANIRNDVSRVRSLRTDLEDLLERIEL
jgi:hypothetical protein